MKNIHFSLQTNQMLLPALIIGIAALLRVLPHAPNFTPLAAMALFGGVYLDKKYAFLLPLAAMFIADIFIGFHASMLIIYLALALTTGIGLWVKKHKRATTVMGASLLASILFFLLTNIVYWPGHNLYPQTIAGQLQSYAMALPFFRNTLLGDLFYTGLFFGGYEVVLRMVSTRKLAHKKV